MKVKELTRQLMRQQERAEEAEAQAEAARSMVARNEDASKVARDEITRLRREVDELEECAKDGDAVCFVRALAPRPR